MTLFWLGLVWLAGIATGSLRGPSPIAFLVGAGLGLLIALVGRGTVRTIGVGAAIFFLGAWRMVIAVPEFGPDHVTNHNDVFQIASVTGVVSDFPDVRDDYIGLRLEAEAIRYSALDESLPLSGGVLVRADRLSEFSFGDRVLAQGMLETPPEFDGFSYRDYLARQGIHSLMANVSVIRLEARQGNMFLQLIFDLRQRALETIYSIFPDPEASLLAGILLGVEGGISTELRQAYNDTSTTHVIAISGFNITVLAALVIALSHRTLGLRRGAVAAAIVIAIYTLFVGADAAVVRAAIMGGLALFARFLGRVALALASLSASAIVMTAVSPLVLWDVGFQLSFAATLGLVLYADRIKQWFVSTSARWVSAARAERLSVPVGEYMLFTLAAQVTTLPLTAFYFRRLSLVSLLANPVILPAQPPLMILGGIATIAGMIWLPLGQVLAWIAWPFPAFTNRAVTAFASVPSAAIDLGQVSLPAVVGLYLLLFGATAWILLPAERRPRLPLPRISMTVSLIALGILTVLLWKAVLDRPDGLLHITAFEQGGVLVETVDGRYILIGGGNSPSGLSTSLGRTLPLFHREIDWLIVSDSRSNGLAGLSAGLTIRAVLGNSAISGGDFTELSSALSLDPSSLYPAGPGSAVDLGDGARVEVAGADGTDFLLLLTYGNSRIVLISRGSISPADLAAVQAPSAVILSTAASTEWLAELEPPVAVSPSMPPSDLIPPGTRVLATDLRGWVELVSDGERIWVTSQRAP